MAYTRGRLPHSSSLSPSFNHIGCTAIAFGTCCSYVVEGGGPLCYYIHTVLLSSLRCSKLRHLLWPPPRARITGRKIGINNFINDYNLSSLGHGRLINDSNNDLSCSRLI
jgi:hypothetical protein